MIFDTHAHYDDEVFDEDREILLNSLVSHGIEAVVNIAADLDSCKTTLELTKQYAHVYGAVGIHPERADQLKEAGAEWIKKLTAEEKIVAIGEIGLDYYWDEPERSIQQATFYRQLCLAEELKLPVVIHSRDAAKDTLDMMKAEHKRLSGGVIHCFSYPKEVARDFLNMGFYLGIGGVVTFKNAAKVKEVVEYMPLDRLVLETDCPYLAPVPNRGKRNSSLNLSYVVREIANIKNISEEEVVDITCRNGKQLYNLI